MRWLAASLSSLALLVLPALAVDERDRTVKLPRPLRAGEAVSVEVQVGVLGGGKEIELTTPAGRPLGVISPFGVRTGQGAGTYTVPIPSELIVNDQITLRLSVSQFGRAQRAPTVDEVKSVQARIAPAMR